MNVKCINYREHATSGICEAEPRYQRFKREFMYKTSVQDARLPLLFNSLRALVFPHI